MAEKERNGDVVAFLSVSDSELVNSGSQTYCNQARQNWHQDPEFISSTSFQFQLRGQHIACSLLHAQIAVLHFLPPRKISAEGSLEYNFQKTRCNEALLLN